MIFLVYYITWMLFRRSGHEIYKIGWCSKCTVSSSRCGYCLSWSIVRLLGCTFETSNPLNKILSVVLLYFVLCLYINLEKILIFLFVKFWKQSILMWHLEKYFGQLSSLVSEKLKNSRCKVKKYFISRGYENKHHKFVLFFFSL